jgi:ketosteroid isomerase-like protein
MLMFLIAFATAATGGDVASIRALRAQSNAAIAAHDFERLRPLLVADYASFPGSLGKPLGVEQTAARLGRAFADPGFVTYVRTPGRIAVSSSGKRAAETGTWIGTWRKSDGVMRLSGVYQAYWVPVEGRWRLQNESFVTLRCAGSRSCADVD